MVGRRLAANDDLAAGRPPGAAHRLVPTGVGQHDAIAATEGRVERAVRLQPGDVQIAVRTAGPGQVADEDDLPRPKDVRRPGELVRVVRLDVHDRLAVTTAMAVVERAGGRDPHQRAAPLARDVRPARGEERPAGQLLDVPGAVPPAEVHRQPPVARERRVERAVLLIAKREQVAAGCIVGLADDDDLPVGLDEAPPAERVLEPGQPRRRLPVAAERGVEMAVRREPRHRDPVERGGRVLRLAGDDQPPVRHASQPPRVVVAAEEVDRRHAVAAAERRVGLPV